jgi:hypothetical protein
MIGMNETFIPNPILSIHFWNSGTIGNDWERLDFLGGVVLGAAGAGSPPLGLKQWGDIGRAANSRRKIF